MLTEDEVEDLNIGDNLYIGAFDVDSLTKNFQPDKLLSLGFQRWELGNLETDLLPKVEETEDDSAGTDTNYDAITPTDNDIRPAQANATSVEEQTDSAPIAEATMPFEVVLKISTRKSLFALLAKIKVEHNVETMDEAFTILMNCYEVQATGQKTE